MGLPRNIGPYELIEKIKGIKYELVNIAIVGKYIELEDSYISVIESLKHGGYANGTNVKIELVDSEKINSENKPLI